MNSFNPIIDKIDLEIRATTIKKRNTVRKSKPLTNIVNTLLEKGDGTKVGGDKLTTILPETPTVVKKTKKREVVWL